MTKNKYHLKMSDIRKMKINREKLFEVISNKQSCEHIGFWRNNVVNAWCISGNTAKTPADDRFCTYSEFWIGFYDEDANAYAGKFKFHISSYGGMCDYRFEEFYKEKDIENNDDRMIQSLFLNKINQLIDIGILNISV